jgi:hypothetical protein
MSLGALRLSCRWLRRSRVGERGAERTNHPFRDGITSEVNVRQVADVVEQDELRIDLGI